MQEDVRDLERAAREDLGGERDPRQTASPLACVAAGPTVRP
jgi:hypothetical protein